MNPTTIHTPFAIETYKDLERNANAGGEIILAVDDMDHAYALLAAYIKNNSLNAAFIRHGIHATSPFQSGYGCYSISASTAPALIKSDASINDFDCYIFDSYKKFVNGRNSSIVRGIKRANYVPIIFIVDTSNEDIPTGLRSSIVSIPKFQYEAKKWTPEEDEFLKQFYPIIGTDVAECIDGARAVDCFTRYLYITNTTVSYGDEQSDNKIVKEEAGDEDPTAKDNKKEWTSKEDEVLKKYWPIEGSNVAERLCWKTAEACDARAAALGLGKKDIGAWSPEEDEILKQYYPIDGANVNKRFTNGRTEADCIKHAIELGIIKKAVGAWTDNEDLVLINNYPNMGSDVVNLLPGRTAIACLRRYNLLTNKKKDDSSDNNKDA